MWERKWALIAYDKLCLPKVAGGLGLHDIEILNNVLGEKLWRRLIQGGRESWK